MSDPQTEEKTRAMILKAGRELIGTPYDQLDCSNFVHKAYAAAGLVFPYRSTRTYAELISTADAKRYFRIIDKSALKPGDLVLYSGHVGLYDPDGCTIINSAACKADKTGDMRILSARSGRNLGVEYGRSSWFGSPVHHLVWEGFPAPAGV